MDKKQCHQCYCELDIDAIFCPRCGMKLIMDIPENELDISDIYRAIIRLETQLKKADISPQLHRNNGMPQMLGAQGVPQYLPNLKKKKSSFNLTSIIIVLLMVLIMVSLSFIGTVLVNVHASGYTKTSGQVVNELLDVFRGGDSESVRELPSEL